MRGFGFLVVLALVAATLSSQPAAAQGSAGQVVVPPIEYRGSQIHLIGEAAGVPGAAVDSTTNIVDFEISDDGTTVWAVIGTQSAGFELLIMSRSGTDLVRKPITASPAPAAVEIALTDPGGAAGIVAVRQSLSGEQHWLFTSTTNSSSTGFFTLYDTSEVGDGSYHDTFDLGGISLATDPQDPTDGFYFVNTRQIFQWNATVPALAGRVAQNSDLRLNGNPLASTVINGGWEGLDVGGGRFIASHDLADPLGWPEAVISGPSLVYETITNAAQPFVRRTQSEISDDGLTASYCLNGGSGFEDVKCYVGPQGGTYDQILPMALNHQITWAGLAGSGTRIIANETFGFSPTWTFFANADGTVRRRAGGLYTFLAGANDVAIGTPKLSANANYAIGKFNTTPSLLTGLEGLTIVADTGGAFLGMPTISNPRFGYDADGSLLVRAEADGGADSVIVWPMRDGYYDPNVDNLSSPPYVDGSVVLNRIGTSNTYGGTLRIRDGFTQPVPGDLLRFSAVNAAGNRSSYADVRLAAATPLPTCNGLTPTVYIGLGDVPTLSSDVILGTPGDDVIDGLGGNDIVCAGEGNDTVVGGDGDDTIFGEGGNDLIRGGPDTDTIEGGPGDDRLLGGTGGDTIDGGDGNDYIGGFGGDDVITGGPGNETIFGGFGKDTIDGGPGADNIRGLIGDDVINGGDGDDKIFGDRGNDELSGGGGNDIVEGGNAVDTVNGNDGDDTLSGGKRDDILNGGAGTDICIGNAHIVADIAIDCETEFGIP